MCIRKGRIVFPRYPLPTNLFSTHVLFPLWALCLCGKSRLFISLAPLCCSQKSQLLCNQANPGSFSESPGVGGNPATRSGGLCLALPSSITSFRINTCKSVTKQKTLSTCTINTYAKPGGGGSHQLAPTMITVVDFACVAPPSEVGIF